jgi:hypothetical protein
MNIYLSHCILLRSPEDRWAPLRIYRSVTFRRKRGWKRACPCQKLRLMSKTTYHYIIKCVPLEKSRVSTFFLKAICVADVSNMSKASIAPPHYSGKDRKGRDNAGHSYRQVAFCDHTGSNQGTDRGPKAVCSMQKSQKLIRIFHVPYPCIPTAVLESISKSKAIPY